MPSALAAGSDSPNQSIASAPAAFPASCASAAKRAAASRSETLPSASVSLHDGPCSPTKTFEVPATVALAAARAVATFPFSPWSPPYGPFQIAEADR
ncbi:hypothetical protein [Sorangium sp. So ce341]|uniref:hypothetical protein n=1 Tax=Sorangium sp. So ce341 TaxID=3133302 RepID=UPI003F5FC624